MGSGPWCGTAVTVALALVASILPWCATTSRAAETYEGYSPIEGQRQVNNPPTPHPIGPRLLRDNIPGVADEMRKRPAFFRDLEMDLHLRSYYFNRELPIRPTPPSGPDTFNQEAWALGVHVSIPRDNRMIPNTFEGVTVRGDVDPVEYYAGYLTAMKPRNSETFINIARAAGSRPARTAGWS